MNLLLETAASIHYRLRVMILFLLLLVVPGPLPSHGAEPGFAVRDDAILAGNTVEPGSHPWMVALVRNTTRTDLPLRALQFCGGALIDQYWVLTAAHCVTARSVSDMAVILGTSDLDQSGLRPESIVQIVVHPEFETRMFSNDIALLRLATPSRLPAIPLFREVPDSVLAGYSAAVLGWGTTYITSDRCAPWIADPGVDASEFDCRIYDLNPLTRDMQADLLQTELLLLSDANCAARIRELVVSLGGDPDTDQLPAGGAGSRICAFDPQGAGGICFGDSGGPLVVTRGGQILLAGITSYTVGTGSCARPLATDVFTKVAYYFPFITEVIHSDLQLGFERYCPPAMLPAVEYSGITAGKGTVRIYWPAYPDATTYTLRYGDFPNPAGTVNAVSLNGALSEIIVELAAGNRFYVSLQAHNANCSGPLSAPLAIAVPLS